MQFKVPQDIDLQDKIIGPLTLSQFFYLLFGGLVLYILFNYLYLNGFVFLFFILAVPIGLFSFAMAFVKVQDRPFPSFVLAFLYYVRQPRSRIWQHSQERNVPKPKPVAKKEPTSTAHKNLDAVKVKELANILDTPQGGPNG